MIPSDKNPPRPPGKIFTGDTRLYGTDTPISRERFLSLSRNYLSVLKGSLIDLRAKEAVGRSYVRAYSHIVDAIVGVLFQRAVQEHGAELGTVELAIIGMGGYGRAELAPYSDVDILVLCKRKTHLVKQIAGSFIQLMWDIGFELGHTVQSLVESEGALGRHMDARTALFESRWICGMEDIAREAEHQKSRLRQKDRKAFVVRKIRDATTRHEKYGNSYQLIEPNVKLSPGGLRDFQTLVWLGMVVDGEDGLRGLHRRRLLLPGEADALEEAHNFLLNVRVELHVRSESKQDQLTVRMQRLITDRLGYRDRGGHLAVELFMRDYYNHTRTVYRITRDIIEELQFGENIGLLTGRKRTTKTTERLSLGINRKRAREKPLYVFNKQKRTGLELDRSLRQRLRNILASDLSGRSERNRMRRDFPKLLSDATNISLLVRSMHDTGYLGAIIPEYNFLTSLKRYDLYHHYTVDEHSFQVVRNLEELASSHSRRIEPFARIYSEIADKQTLHLAALLHDIGKIEGKGHAKKGAEISRRILKRMSLGKVQIEAVSALIEIHLLMSHYSQRRDPADIGTLKSFCSRVKTRTNLKYLCLLTYADLKATSPHVWTDWKHTLLWGFYLKAYQFMARKEKKAETFYKARKSTILRDFPGGPGREEALEHLDKLPGRYLLTMKASQVRGHLALIRQLKGQRGVVSSTKAKLSTEISFCTLDKPFRLSQLCGVLTLNDCNILFANAFTRTDGVVVDVFHVEDVSGTMPIDEHRIEKLRKDLDEVLKGKLDIGSTLAKYLVKWKRRKHTSIPVPFRVEFDNDISPDVTILDIFAADQPGLLFGITRVLSEEGLTIHRARISTEAYQAIDSFDIQDKRGRKITNVTKLRDIRNRLEKELG